MRAICALLIAFALLLGPLNASATEVKPAQASRSWLYLNSFQSKKLIALDPMTGSVMSTIEVDDLAGSLGFGVTYGGKRLLIVDGGARSRLRVLDAATRGRVAEHFFDHRALLLGGGPAVHLTADDRWLFVDTCDYAAAAKGVRIFDIKSGHFMPMGLRERGCDSIKFASAHNGLVLGVCPNFLQTLQSPPPQGESEWIGTAKVETSIESPAYAALSSDGKKAYVMGYLEAGRPWPFARWRTGHPLARMDDLRAVLDNFHGDVPDPRGRAIPAMGLSPYGGLLAIVAGPHLWLLDSEVMHVVQHHVKLPFLDHVVFTSDGPEMLTLHSLEGGRGELLRISTQTAQIARMSLDHLNVPFVAGMTVFTLAPAP
jgi:hypothetical protein